MKKFRTYFVLAILILSASESYPQDTDIDLLEEANNLQRNKEYVRALNLFDSVLSCYKGGKAYPYALYGKAETLENLKNKDLSVVYYKDFLHRYYKVREIYNTIFGYGAYNSAYISAIKIAEYNYENGNYDEALKYYIFADTANLYTSTCGSSYMSEKFVLSLFKARCFNKLGMDKEAMDIVEKYILPGVFSQEKGIIDFAIEVTNKNYGHQSITSEIERSVDNIYLVTNKNSSDKKRFALYFLGNEIFIRDVNKKKTYEVESLDKAKEIARNTKYFKYYLSPK